MPESIPVFQQHIWQPIHKHIESGIFAVNEEIYQELCCLNGPVGECLKKNKDKLVLEVGENWNWQLYIQIVEDMRTRHKDVIAEYNGNRKGTVGLNDVAIVALAKCLNLPLISMESKTFQTSATKVRIPGLCALEGVQHLDFNDFLRQG